MTFLIAGFALVGAFDAYLWRRYWRWERAARRKVMS
jgi:hypothetical protein